MSVPSVPSVLSVPSVPSVPSVLSVLSLEFVTKQVGGYMRKLEVVHKQVAGYLTDCALFAAWFALNGNIVSQSLRKGCLELLVQLKMWIVIHKMEWQKLYGMTLKQIWNFFRVSASLKTVKGRRLSWAELLGAPTLMGTIEMLAVCTLQVKFIHLNKLVGWQQPVRKGKREKEDEKLRKPLGLLRLHRQHQPHLRPQDVHCQGAGEAVDFKQNNY